MFTGIIEELGKIKAIEKHEKGAAIVISALKVVEGSNDGDSISVNGVCLTALNIDEQGFSADVSQETLDRSTLGFLDEGSPVNLERAVTPATRLGGHIVQGHVDGCGEFVSAINEGDFWTVKIAFPQEMAKFLVYKGSVSVEGISLTVAELFEESFDIAVIPKTWEATNLSSLAPGDKVNLEVDVIAKYVERMLQFRDVEEPSEKGITVETLRDLGFA